MTWSPCLSVVTFGPVSTTTPAPSWPRIAGNSPSGSAPESVNASVWQTPVAFISTRTSPDRGPSRSMVVTSSGWPDSFATAALTFTILNFRCAETDETVANRELAFIIRDFEKNARIRNVAVGIGENAERQSGRHRYHRTESARDATHPSWIGVRATLDDSRHCERERRCTVKNDRGKTGCARDGRVGMNRIKDAGAFGVNVRHPGRHLYFNLVARIHGRIGGCGPRPPDSVGRDRTVEPPPPAK